jgi:hypothetical protein
MRRALAALAVTLFGIQPALALEPERREVVVTHNRVWDGHSYKENFVPSGIGEIHLLSGVDNALNFVRTQEYYWPLARQTYVAFERQRDEVEGVMVIRAPDGTTTEVERIPYSIHYPNGAVSGDGELLWGEEAVAAHADYRRQEQEFVRELAEIRRAHTEYERALRDAAIARMSGEGVIEVPPPPARPEPMLRLVTSPQPGFRVNLPAGRYEAALVVDGADVPGTRKTLNVIDDTGSGVVVLDIVPEERWTRPIQSNRAEDRVYVRPGARFFVTAHNADRYAEHDYARLVRPQATAPRGRQVWVRRNPAEARQMQLAWRGEDAPLSVPLADLKVVQTQGGSFGYQVRDAEAGEIPDLAAFTVVAPSPAHRSGGRMELETPIGATAREVVVVQPRNSGLAWSLAFLPAALGVLVGWRNWSRRR